MTERQLSADRADPTRETQPSLNVCEFDHKTHDTKTIDTVAGPMVIYDWTKYRGLAGYCPGQDDVSMSLDLYGTWEPEDWDRPTPEGRSLDFGAHIGWYTIKLAKLGPVVAIDADPINCELLALNTRGMDVHIINSWVGDLAQMTYKTAFIKADVEGNEDQVMWVCRDIIRDQHPQMLLECSPEFADYYPDMIRYLQLLGYNTSMQPEDLKTQANVWFT